MSQVRSIPFRRRRRGGDGRSASLLMLVLLALLAVFGAAQASAAPSLTVSVEAEDVLFGQTGRVNITATNGTVAGTTTGYNVSYRVVLPAGVTYEGGLPSSVPTPRIVLGQPGAGQTTLIWSNLSDLTPGSDFSIGFDVNHAQTAPWGPGSTYTITAGAYASDLPRTVPAFAANGTPVANPAVTGVTDVDTATVLALEVTHDTPGEILRGVHEHRQEFAVTVTNNSVAPTNGVVLHEYLPAGLEYLGCGTATQPWGVDQTTEAPTNPGSDVEYATAPGLNATDFGTVDDCVAPTAITTVENPPDMTPGIYTQLTFTVGDLGIGDAMTFRYVAGVPLAENTMFPDGSAAIHAPNLDNNGGPETRHRQPLPVTGVATGDYNGTLAVSDTETATWTAMDIIVVKDRDRAAIEIGAGQTQWTIDVTTSEYRSFQNITVTDALPDGLRAVSATPAWATPAAVPVDGPADITWDLPAQGPSSPSATITLITEAQPTYSGTDPVSAADTWSNGARVAGNAHIRCAVLPTVIGPCAPDQAIWSQRPDGELLEDTDAAAQTAAQPTIDKQVQADTDAHASPAGLTFDDTSREFSPGDTVWYRLRVNFPPLVNTRGMTVVDFLPPGTSYVAGSAQALPGMTLPFVAPDPTGAEEGILEWTMPQVAPAEVFDVAFQVRVERAATSADGDLLGNLMKGSFLNNEGRSFPLRDSVDLELAQPVVSITTGVSTWTPGGPAALGPNQDNRVVPGAAAVIFRVDPRNTGSQDAEDAVIRTVLPSVLDCGMISAISDSGACAGGVITWTDVDIAVGATPTLFYTAALPVTLAPGAVVAPEAGVVSFETTSNGGATDVWFPLSNIDTTITDDSPAHEGRRVPAADDPTSVRVSSPTITHTIAAPFTQAGNSATLQGSIGETVRHTTTVNLPADTTLINPSIVDTVTAGLALNCSAGTYTATIGGVDATTLGWNIACAGATVTVSRSDTYQVPVNGQAVLITYESVIANSTGTPNNVRGQTRRSGTNFTWGPAGNRAQATSNSQWVTIVEPRVGVGIAPSSSSLLPGQTVNYTVTASNGTGTNVSTANNTVVVVTVPEGLTPTATGTGVWDAGARTITFPAITTLTPGANDGGRTFTVQVDNDVVAGRTYTVTARADTESLPAAGHPSRRTAISTPTTTDYRATASADVTIPGSTLSKSADKANATIGEVVTHMLSFPLAANVAYHDLTILDTLPANLTYGGSTTVSSTCTPAGGDPGDCALSATALAPAGQTLGFTIGDVAAAPQVRTVTITYATRVAAAASAGDTLTNSAVLYSNTTPKGTPTTIPSDPDAVFDNQTPPATAITTVVEPAPTIAKSVAFDGGPDLPSGSTITATDTATYSITVSNTGTSPLHDAVVVDTPDTQLLASSITAGTVTAPAGVTVSGPEPAGPWTTVPADLTWRTTGPLAPGASVVIRYSARIDPAAVAQDDEIDNSVAVARSYGLPESLRTAPGTTPADFAEYSTPPATTKLVVDLPELGIVKTAATPPPGTVPAGATTGYTIAVTNTGPVRATDLVITDALPAGVNYAPGAATAAITNPTGPATGFAETDGTGPSLEWTLPGLSAGSTLTITVPVTLDGDLDDAQTLTNTAGVSSYERPTPVTDPADILTARSADVAITKTGPTTLDAGEIAEWTLTATNNGPSNARDVVVTDSIPVETTLLSVAPTPACTVAGRDITCALGTLDAGDSRTITIRARVNNDTTVDILNTATITSTDPDPDPSNNTSEHPTLVGNRVDLTITKTGAQPRILQTATNTYTLTARNLGPSNSYDTTVVDTLPAGLTALSATTAAGTCTVPNPQRVECDLGTLVADGTATITVVARGDGVGTHTNTATVDTGRGTDADPSNNSDTAVVVVDPLVDLSITKTGPAQVAAGGRVDYALRITNHGPSPATGVTITDELPAGMEPLGASPGCTAAGRVVTCAIGDLPVGASAERGVTARVDAGVAGQTLQNVARVAGNEAEPDLTNNTDTAQTRVGEAADLRVVKSGTAPFPGGQVTYTLDVINDGPTTAVNATLVDELPEGLGYVSSLATQGSCTVEGRRVLCGLGHIPSGGAVTVQIVASVDAGIPAGTAITNTATVGSDTLDPDPGNNTSTVTDPTRPGAAPKPNILLTKRATATRPRVGQAFEYILRVTNRGPGRATGVTVHDPIPADVRVLGVRTTRGRCVTDGPVVRCAIGTLAARRSATVTVRVMMATTGRVTNRAVAAADGTPAVAARVAVAGVRATATAGRIAITKRASRSRVTAGGVVDYRIQVRATRSSVSRVRVCDVLPKGMVFVRAKGATLSGRRACWTVPWLDPGTPKTFAVRARAEVTASGSLRNVARATAPGTRAATARAQVAVIAKRMISPGGVTG